jgi:hypothetical protein
MVALKTPDQIQQQAAVYLKAIALRAVLPLAELHQLALVFWGDAVPLIIRIQWGGVVVIEPQVSGLEGSQEVSVVSIQAVATQAVVLPMFAVTHEAIELSLGETTVVVVLPMFAVTHEAMELSLGDTTVVVAEDSSNHPNSSSAWLESNQQP